MTFIKHNCKLELPKINIEQKKGTEIFYFEDKELNFKLNDFWIWNQSNLIENRNRGILAEFIVKQVLRHLNIDRKKFFEEFDKL